MPVETDLVGEQDPEERLELQDEQLQERTRRDDNHRKRDLDGAVTTEDFDVKEAIESLQEDD